MNQEETFKDFYKSISPEDVNDEINTLAHIRLSVDFYEYLITDPEKLLAIIHYNNLEETYGIRVVFDTTDNNDSAGHFSDHNDSAGHFSDHNDSAGHFSDHNDSAGHFSDHNDSAGHFSDHTGNMSIIFRFNDDIYRISTMIDSVTNNTIYDSFCEQVQLVLNNYKAKIISREEAELKKIEHEISVKHSAAVNVMWHVLNSPKNIKDLLEQIDNNTFEECREDTSEQREDTSEQREDPSEQREDIEDLDDPVCKSDVCPMMAVLFSMLFAIGLRYMELRSQYGY